MSEFKSKDKIDYTTLLMWQMNRIHIISALPEVNVRQLGRCIDILDAATCFLGLEDFTAPDNDAADNVVYEACMKHYRAIVDELYKKGFLFQWNVDARLGKQIKADKAGRGKAKTVSGMPLKK